MYCPECGTHIFNYFPKNKWENTFSEAWLRVEDDNKANYDCMAVGLENDLKQIIANYHSGEESE